MAERLPRRLRRFQRKGEQLPEEEEVMGIEPERERPQAREGLDKETTMELALQEVELFKQQHNRLPKKEEYDRIAESIYSQLREEEQREKAAQREGQQFSQGFLQGKKAVQRAERGGPQVSVAEEESLSPAERVKLRRQGLLEKQQAKAVPRSIVEDKKQRALAELRKAAKGVDESKVGLSVEDVFGKGKEKKKEQEREEVDLGSLEESEEEATEGDEFGLEDLSMGGEEETAGDKCPNCKNVTEEVIFCPECSTAFCEKCAKKIEIIAGAKNVVCPSCGTRVKR